MSFPISAPPSEPQIRGHFYWALKGTLSLGFNTVSYCSHVRYCFAAAPAFDCCPIMSFRRRQRAPRQHLSHADPRQPTYAGCSGAVHVILRAYATPRSGPASRSSPCPARRGLNRWELRLARPVHGSPPSTQSGSRRCLADQSRSFAGWGPALRRDPSFSSSGASTLPQRAPALHADLRLTAQPGRDLVQ